MPCTSHARPVGGARRVTPGFTAMILFRVEVKKNAVYILTEVTLPNCLQFYLNREFWLPKGEFVSITRANKALCRRL